MARWRATDTSLRDIRSEATRARRGYHRASPHQRQKLQLHSNVKDDCRTLPLLCYVQAHQGRSSRQKSHEPKFALSLTQLVKRSRVSVLHSLGAFQMSLTKPISTNLSIGTFKFAILLRVLWRTNRKMERRNDRQYGDALRMLISSFPMT